MFALFGMLVYGFCGILMFVGGLGRLITQGMRDSTGAMPAFDVDASFWFGAGLAVIFLLGSLVPTVAVTVRRLHDRDLSGWWYLGALLLGQVPFIGALISLAFLVIMCLDGTRGPNRFGEDPKDPASADVFG